MIVLFFFFYYVILQKIVLNALLRPWRRTSAIMCIGDLYVFEAFPTISFISCIFQHKRCPPQISLIFLELSRSQSHRHLLWHSEAFS